MEFIIFILFTFSFISSADGLPENDPVIKNLRNRFEIAREPKSEDLLKKKFECKIFSAKKGIISAKNYPYLSTFTSFDGLFQYRSKSSNANNIMMVRSGSELIGTVKLYKMKNQYFSIRVDQEENLIAEWTCDQSFSAKSLELQPLTKELPIGQKVHSYLLCIKSR